MVCVARTKIMTYHRQYTGGWDSVTMGQNITRVTFWNITVIIQMLQVKTVHLWLVPVACTWEPPMCTEPHPKTNVSGISDIGRSPSSLRLTPEMRTFLPLLPGLRPGILVPLVLSLPLGILTPHKNYETYTIYLSWPPAHLNPPLCVTRPLA